MYTTRKRHTQEQKGKFCSGKNKQLKNNTPLKFKGFTENLTISVLSIKKTPYKGGGPTGEEGCRGRVGLEGEEGGVYEQNVN